MAQVTLTFTPDQVAASLAAVANQAINLASNPDVAPKLPEGTTPDEVAAWAPVRQLKLVLYAHLMMVRQNYERDLAARLAGEQAVANARDTSPMEVDDVTPS